MIRFSTHCMLAAAALFGVAGFILPETAAPRTFAYLMDDAGALFMVVGLVAWFREEPLT